jgi:hypothetical protein
VAWFARYLHYTEAEVLAMTPEQSHTLRRAGQKFLDGEEKARLEHTKGIMRAGTSTRIF